MVKRFVFVSKLSITMMLMVAFLAGLAVLPALGAESAASTPGELAREIKPFLSLRTPQVALSYSGPMDALFCNLQDLLPQAMGSDDYLQYNMDSWRVSASGYPGDVTVLIEARYLTTLKQEQELETSLAEALPGILAGTETQAEKIRAIHDAIGARVAYDAELKEYSACAGWMKGLTVCQGYALLTDKMLGMAGVPSRILAGTLDGGAHAWNLVKVDGEWLHLDVTNDDANRSDRYYLVRDEVLLAEGFVFDAKLRGRLIREAEEDLVHASESMSERRQSLHGKANRPMISNRQGSKEKAAEQAIGLVDNKRKRFFFAS